MNIYRITATQDTFIFTQNIKADSYQDARNKFKNNISKKNFSFPYIQPEVDVTKITKRY